MELMHIPLSELTVAKTNVRHGVKSADYKDLMPSIKERGILQPLLVRPNDQGYEIVAGDLAPNFYPVLSSLRRFNMPCWAGDAMAMGVEPSRYAASMAIACADVAVFANSDGVNQPSPECGRC
jgi:hypothetical protein